MEIAEEAEAEEAEAFDEENGASGDYLDVDLSVDLGNGIDEEAAEEDPSADESDAASAEENETE